MAHCSNHNKTGPTLQGKPNFSEIANFGAARWHKAISQKHEPLSGERLDVSIKGPQWFLLPVKCRRRGRKQQEKRTREREERRSHWRP
jgi:hypothetical protein